MKNETKLTKIRNEIDRIDKELLKLFIERMKMCSAVADYKRSVNMKILDPEREKQVLQNKMNMLKDDDFSADVYEFFSDVMAISRERQSRAIFSGKKPNKINIDVKIPIENPKVVFYGRKGSYCESAAKHMFDCDSFLPAHTFDDVFNMVKSGEADYAVLPIENSTTGTVIEVCDLLLKHSYFITKELFLPIRHCLVGIKGAKIDDIDVIYSHSQALKQCTEFIKELSKNKDIELREYFSTAASAKKVSEDNLKNQAAIAGYSNSEIYNLDVLEKNISNDKNNVTRFVVVSKQLEICEGAQKISASFKLSHKSGELYRILRCFAKGGLNLLKIESRPVPKENFEYMFFIDFLGNLNDKKVMTVLENVADEVKELKIVGNYSEYTDHLSN